MIRILQLKLPVLHTEEELKEKILHTLRIRPEELKSWKIVRRSIDARKKDALCFVYQIDVETPKEKRILSKSKHNEIMSTNKKGYRFPKPGSEELAQRPVVIGSGPAGLFCAYYLAKSGYCPILLERGDEAHVRQQKVEQFWNTGILDTESNVQFGEGGAGTFSDGKLNTSVKDPHGRNQEVLRIFCEAGAPPEILYDQKPHLGTDQLITIVQNMRHQIEAWGGTVRFRACVTDFDIKDGRLVGVTVNDSEYLETSVAVLAVGHSARDTFAMLHAQGLPLVCKPFSVGFRAEHLQTEIEKSLYHGAAGHPALPRGEYQLSQHVGGGRCVYTFCMCPGGTVCAAASEEGGVVTNGMSLHARDGRNANAAVVVSVDGKDFDQDPARAVAFQRRLEQAAFRAGGGAYRAPAETVGSFLQGRGRLELDRVQPTYPRGVTPADLGALLPEELSGALREGLAAFGRKLAAYRSPDAVLTGLETRTSSPVRLLRDADSLQCTALEGLYPCGEGAGYAGGIMTAAVDGVRCAAALMQSHAPAAH